MIEQKTWLIWRALHRQPTELGQRLDDMRDDEDEHPTKFKCRYLWLGLGAVIIGLIILRWVASVDWLTITLSNGLILIFGSIIILILASGTLNGARWAFQVATIVYRDIHEGRYDLMSLSPLGVLGALWLMTHQHNRMNRVVAFFQTVGLALFLALILIGVIFIYTLLQGPPTLFLSQPILGGVLIVAWAILVFYLDYVQAIVVGHLTAIYLASVATSLQIAEVGSVVLLLGVQIGTYMFASLVALLSAILATFLFQNTRDASLVLVAIAFVSTSYLFREVVIRVLWRTILVQFAVTNVEFAKFRQALP